MSDRDRWNQRWSERTPGLRRDSSLVELLRPWLTEPSRLLEVAGGGSGVAVALAEGGHDVTIVDVSDVGLEMARNLAAESGVSLTTVLADVKSESLPAGPWQVICVANFLHRPLLRGLAENLEPGGLLAIVLATTTNLERNARPSRQFLIEPGEIPGLVPDLEVLHHTEAWRASGRHEAWFVGRALTRDGVNDGG